MYRKSGTEIPEVFWKHGFQVSRLEKYHEIFPQIYGISYVSHLLSIIWDTRISSPMDASKYVRIVSSVWIVLRQYCGEKVLKLKFPIHFGKARKNMITIYILSSSKGSIKHGNLNYYLRPCDVGAKEPLEPQKPWKSVGSNGRRRKRSLGRRARKPFSRPRRDVPKAGCGWLAGFKCFVFSPFYYKYLRGWSNLTSLFFKWIEATT